MDVEEEDLAATELRTLKKLPRCGKDKETSSPTGSPDPSSIPEHPESFTFASDYGVVGNAVTDGTSSRSKPPLMPSQPIPVAVQFYCQKELS
jgi:hypothetical protein